MDRAGFWQKPGPLALLRGWRRDGVEPEEIARRMGLKPKGLRQWRQKYPAIEGALALNREMADYQVEDALLRAALGYRVEETKTEPTDRGEKLVTTEKEVCPNVTAISLWLKRRKPEVWDGVGEETGEQPPANNLFAALGNWEEEVLRGDAVSDLQPTAETDPDLVETP